MFAECLQNLRKSKNYSQEKMADILGVPTRTYGSCERNEREPGFSVLCKIADHFGVSTDYLLGRTPMILDIKKETPPPKGEGVREIRIPLDTPADAGEAFEQRIQQLIDQELNRRGIG